MVERQCEGHHIAHLDTTVDDPRPGQDPPEGQDRHLTRVQDRRAPIHAEHADVGDRDGGAAQVLGA